MMEKEQYVIEREYLGIISVREFISAIIKKHDDYGSKCKQSDCVKTVKESLDL